MKKQYKFIALLALASGSLFAQQIIPCATDEAMKDLFAKDPAAKARFEKSQKEPLTAEQAQRFGNNQVTTTYALDTIPVVFHILHQNGPENIADNIVYQCLAEINRVHTKTIPDTASIDPLFKAVAAANNYVFQLATKDPNGNCTNGIVHHLDPNTDWDQSSPQYSYSGTSAGKWNPTKYLNIYVVRQIIPPGGNTGGGIVVGYTYLPGSFSAGSAYDVVVYNYQFMTGTNARSMAHEFGHWLGLAHTFGSTNSPGTCMSGGASDDFLANGTAGADVTDDTPKTPGAFSTCPDSSPNTCDVSNTQNVQNIMDYSSCPKNFTAGQVKRMHNTMGLATAGRNNICSATNKIATGVRFPQVCIPTANFHATTRTACPGATITFSDSSANAHPTAWQWSFPGGTLVGTSTLTDSMPKVSYAAAGTYAVTYTATSSAGSNSITKSSWIHINTNVASYNTAFQEGFETATLPGADWSLYGDGLAWAVTSSAAATGLNSAEIDNFVNAAGTSSILESTSFNIQGFATPKLTFKLSYQQQLSTNVDKLQIQTSTDCGYTWTARWTRSGGTLATVTPPSTVPFTPGPSNFTTYTVNINGIAGSTNARFRFVFWADAAGQGNNLFIDDINLFDASVGIAPIDEQVGLHIYPNPSSGKINLDLNLSEKHTVAVSVNDMLGRTVETIPFKEYGSGELSFGLAEKKVYQSGVYFINIDVDGQRISRKVIISE